MICPAVTGSRTACWSASSSWRRASSEAAPKDRRGRLGVAAAAEDPGRGSGVELLRAAADDAEHPAVHLDEQHERLRVGQVDDLVREVRDPVDVARPGDGRDEHLDPGHLVRLERVEQRAEQLALVAGQRRVQELGEQLLARPVAQAPRERLGVALRRRRIGERAGVLVDPERERRRLERRHGELALGEHADERGRQRAVIREEGVLLARPLRRLARVVVEDDLLDLGIERDAPRARRAGSHGWSRRRSGGGSRRSRAGRPRRARARRRAGARTRGRCGSASPPGRRPRPG